MTELSENVILKPIILYNIHNDINDNKNNKTKSIIRRSNLLCGYGTLYLSKLINCAIKY